MPSCKKNSYNPGEITNIFRCPIISEFAHTYLGYVQMAKKNSNGKKVIDVQVSKTQSSNAQLHATNSTTAKDGEIHRRLYSKTYPRVLGIGD